MTRATPPAVREGRKIAIFLWGASGGRESDVIGIHCGLAKPVKSHVGLS
jgi:hypothetical protein